MMQLALIGDHSLLMKERRSIRRFDLLAKRRKVYIFLVDLDVTDIIWTA